MGTKDPLAKLYHIYSASFISRYLPDLALLLLPGNSAYVCRVLASFFKRFAICLFNRKCQGQLSAIL